MFRVFVGSALTAVLLASTALAAPYDRDRFHQQPTSQIFHGRGSEMRSPEFGEHNFRGHFAEFSDRDRLAWQHGEWRHERHGDRFGWWFVADGLWFLYSDPIYPYPDYVAEAPLAPPTAGAWYYCHNPRGYYPYVTYCRSSWETVPVAPPPG